MVFCLGIMAYAQNAPQVRDGLKTHSATIENMVGVEPLKAATPSPAAVPTPNFRAPNAVSIMDIGTSGNAYGFGYGGGQKTIIYYNGDLNTITNFHRMGGELDPTGYNGDLGYDVSFDGGMTWTNMVETYVATEPSGQYYADAARYPQAVIYNPEGNTDPANAWLAFFAPNLDATNGTWGGYSDGIHKMTAASNVDTTKNLTGSAGEYFQYIPDGMDINRVTGTVLVADMNQDWSSGSLDYLGQLMISRGTYSEAEGDIVYEKILIDAPIVNVEEQGRPAIIRVAYSPDGETAWIVILGDNGENEHVIENQMTYYPILYKSEDDGLTWSDPINVQMDGPDGIPSVLNYITDVQWDTLWAEPIPERDEIPFTSGFDCDLVIDANGNPHVAVAVGVGNTAADSYSIITAYPYMALMDIYSPDGGETWEAVEIGRPQNFRGTFGDLTEDNRVCAATNWDATKIFFTYLDTDPEVNPDDNNSPDIWARGFDPMANMMTADAVGADMPTNVTFGSAAMWQSYFGTLSSFVIQDGDSYTLPIVYEEMTPDDPGAAVQFKYIKDFAFVDADFTIQVGPAPLIANFSADETTVDEGATVNFTDMSAGATSWSWEFEGGEPATSNEQNPAVVYATEGVYDVTLTVSNGTEEDMMTKDDYITVNGGGGDMYTVEFHVDMNDAIAAGDFVVGTDVVYLTGSIVGWIEPGQDGSIMMSDDDGDGIYAASMDLAPGDYQYKYFKNAGWDGGEWTGDPNRDFSVVDAAVTLEDLWGFITGIEELESMITISPNPATNYFKVAADRNYTVEVMDLSGRIVTTAQMMSNVVIINMDDQEAGIYIVRMSNETVSFFKKIVKQ